ncbi:ABC transporter permease, partial [Acinetobacter baumannii]
PLALIQRALFNTREGYGSTIFPGVAFLIIHQTLLMGLALLAGTIRERHGMRRLAPATLLGVALAFFVIGCADVAYFTGFVFWFQDYPRA